MAEVELVRLCVADGSWVVFRDQWVAECAKFEEGFEDYATASIPVLEALAAENPVNAGVYALRYEDGQFHAVLQANSTLLPGYGMDRVLRIRHLLVSPRYDFGDMPIEDYSRVLTRTFARVVALSVHEMPSPHIKMHLRSPADVQFFREVGSFLGDMGIFTSVQMRGAWLYLTKSPDMMNVISGEGDAE